MSEIRYCLEMPEPHTHRVRVEMNVGDVRGPADLVMPAWTPGSYLIREFARNVQSFAAEDGAGRALRWSKPDKHTWRVHAPPDGVLRVAYTVYANELSVRTSHLDASHAFLNGAGIFFYLAGREREPIRLEVQALEGWRVTTALPAGEAEGVFGAAGYDQLVDSPLEIGTQAVREWKIDEMPHRYAIWGRGNVDPDSLVRDTTAIVRAGRQLFGELPYPDFTFLLHLTAGIRGGLEHRASTALQVDRWSFRGKPYTDVLALVAHEHFHAWNGKRIRPAALGPFDYTREVHTAHLWVVEGITTYYTDLLLRRAGRITADRYLERLAETITRFQSLPGARAQTLEASSWDAWTRFYRPDADTPNSQVSYYQKGALVALLLDMRIRRATGNARSLDDLMRLLWERYGAPDRGFPEDAGICPEAEEVCGGELGDFFDTYLRTTQPLPLAEALATVGVGVEQAPAPSRPDAPLGMRLAEQGGRTRVTHVLAGSPAYDAGVNAGDELLALDGLRVGAASLPERVAELAPGAGTALTVFRRDELCELRIEAGAPAMELRLRPIENPSAGQAAALADWLRTDVPAEEPDA